MMRIYLDTETTGLDPRVHEAYEVAWSAEPTDLMQRLILPHDISRADPDALEFNGYHERGISQERVATREDIALLHEALQGKTLVCANPPFDRAFLSNLFHRFGLEPEPWHYRSLDVESVAGLVLGERTPPSMKRIVARLNDEYDAGIPEGDHTAMGDVETLIAVMELSLIHI